ncbi:MAG: hypothetical protein ACYTDY_11790 [Planctomycetota bacterium]|jgi:hypothetical protein
MRRTVLLVVAFLILSAGVAQAKAPRLADLPTVKMVSEEAQRLIVTKRAAALAAQKDPKMDLIRDYADHKVNYWRYQGVAEILIDEKEEMKYRRRAAEAFLDRFEELNAWDDDIKKVKIRIGQQIVRALHDGNLEIRVLVAKIFQRYWPGQYSRFGYNPEETAYARRNKAVKKWREFLAGR